MFRLKLVPDQTKIDFLGLRRFSVGGSAIGVIVSLALLLVVGLNFGIDFRGGTMIEVQTQGPADLGQLRRVVGGLGLGDVAVQEFGAPSDVLIRVEQQAGAGDEQMAVVGVVKEALAAQFPGIEFRRVEVVGPKVSGELIVDGVMAIIAAVALVLFYIWLRFEWQFAVGAVIALMHDVALTIGVFAAIQID